ncbi:MAG: BofC C-terminal domain-containing protein [Defluviitaleaceae bacterium]|nr:BofC C-terminal domain-containing protein [Defluviitaleaceae bacterium]
MAKKFKHLMLAERIPTLVCLAACTVSVLMGFVVGYIFLGQHENAYIYAEAAEPYRADITHPVTADTYIEQPVEEIPSIIEEETHLYVVTALDGYIVIFHAASYGGGLKEITSTPVGILDSDEQERLAEGIKIYSEEALTRILQDYGS